MRRVEPPRSRGRTSRPTAGLRFATPRADARARTASRARRASRRRTSPSEPVASSRDRALRSLDHDLGAPSRSHARPSPRGTPRARQGLPCRPSPADMRCSGRHLRRPPSRRFDTSGARAPRPARPAQPRDSSGRRADARRRRHQLRRGPRAATRLPRYRPACAASRPDARVTVHALPSACSRAEAFPSARWPASLPVSSPVTAST